MTAHRDPGHTVLAVGVPALEAFVRRRTAHYDSAYLSDDAGFAHAHVTVLAPWLTSPTPDGLERVRRVCADTEPFSYALREVATFPDGTIHLRAEPADAFSALTQRVREEFPDCVPYDGRFGDDLVPHLTLDAVGPGVDEDVVGAWIADLLPVTARATRLQLQWWQAGRCHVQHEWSLGRREQT